MMDSDKMPPSLALEKAFKTALTKVDKQYNALLEWSKLDTFQIKEDINTKPFSREEMTEFFIGEKIKIMKDGVLTWNPEFIKGYFGKLAKTYVVHIAKEILAHKSEFEHFQERLSSGDFKDFLGQELKKTDLVLSSYEGRSYLKAKRSGNELDHFERLLRFSNNEDISLNLLSIDSPYRPALDMGHFSQIKLLSDMWLKIESAIVMDEVVRSLLNSIKKPVDIEKCPFNIETPIFLEDGQDYLFHILLKSGVIIYNSENEKVEMAREFRGACKVLFFKLRAKKIINPSATLASFIEYLNDTKGYNACIPQKSKGNIATKDTESNAWKRVEVEFSKIFG